jgi:hypothetical protein
LIDIEQVDVDVNGSCRSTADGHVWVTRMKRLQQNKGVQAGDGLQIQREKRTCSAPHRICMHLQLHAVAFAHATASALGLSSSRAVGQRHRQASQTLAWHGPSAAPASFKLVLLRHPLLTTHTHTHLTRHACLSSSDSGSGPDDLLRTTHARAQHTQRKCHQSMNIAIRRRSCCRCCLIIATDRHSYPSQLRAVGAVWTNVFGPDPPSCEDQRPVPNPRRYERAKMNSYSTQSSLLGLPVVTVCLESLDQGPKVSAPHHPIPCGY